MDLLTLAVHSTTKNYEEEQWQRLIGVDGISHAELIYYVLNYYPKNIIVPLIKDLGIGESVIQDKVLSEEDFLEKYEEVISLPIVSNDNNSSSIIKFKRLLYSDFIKDTINLDKNSLFICLDYKSAITFALYYIILKKKFFEDYILFKKELDKDNIREFFEQPDYPSINLLLISCSFDESKYKFLDCLFSNFHYYENYEERCCLIDEIFTPCYIKSCTLKMIELYENFCFRNGITPLPEVMAIKSSQSKKDPQKEFEEKFTRSIKDDDSKHHLGLDLTARQLFRDIQ